MTTSRSSRLKSLPWRVIGPQEVTQQLPPASVIALEAASSVAPGLRIEALPTPHADVQHFSYVVEWHGRRFYFSGDTEDPTSVLNQRGLDIAFVTPWMLKAVASSGRRVDAARVVIYHHTARERVDGMYRALRSACPGCAVAAVRPLTAGF